MSTDLQAITKWIDPVWKGLMLLGVAAVLWLNQNYLTRVEFKEHRAETESEIHATNKRLVDIEKTLAVIAEKMVNDARQDSILMDIERRLREIEKKI
jgi:small-conductance mechanosensitive channel